MSTDVTIKVVQHSTKSVLTFTWLRDDRSTVVDLTGAALTGKIKRNGVQMNITGTLAIISAASGTFSWTLSAADVATAGTFQIWFRAKYSNSLSEMSPRFLFYVLPAGEFELVSPSVSPSASASASASGSA